MSRRRPRPKRIRCCCCARLMAYEAYKPGDAIRRPPPQANVCIDCLPRQRRGNNEWESIRRSWERDVTADSAPKCDERGCEPAPVIDKLVALVSPHRERYRR